MQCSKCHGTIYCSTNCQRADWPQHKRSACIKPPMLHKLDKMMKKYSGPNYPMARLAEIEKAAWDERRRNPVPATKCDGCFRRFRGAPIEEDDDDYDSSEEGSRKDAGDVFKRCADCDFTICEDCSMPENQGIAFYDRPSGTCRCKTSNFGVKYCLSGPSYLDGDGEKPYHGDRHPPIEGSGYDEDAYESKERRCKTCGVVARCLKKEHLKDVMPGMK